MNNVDKVTASAIRKADKVRIWIPFIDGYAAITKREALRILEEFSSSCLVEVHLNIAYIEPG